MAAALLMLALLVLALLPLLDCAPYAGPYRLAVLTLHTCPNTTEAGPMEGGDFTMNGHIRHNMTLRERVWDGLITTKNNVGHPGNTRVKLDMARWDSVSGWREHFLVMQMGELCNAINIHVHDLFVHLAKNIPGLPSRCPIPNVRVMVSNVPARLPALQKFPIMPYGRYKAHVFGYPWRGVGTRAIVCCIEFVVDILPLLKNSKLGS